MPIIPNPSSDRYAILIYRYEEGDDEPYLEKVAGPFISTAQAVQWRSDNVPENSYGMCVVVKMTLGPIPDFVFE